MRKYYGVALLMASASIVVSTRLHQLINNPHLTEAQAFTHYLPLWVSAVICLLAGYLVSKASSE